MERELEIARTTNRRLNRRVQELESELAAYRGALRQRIAAAIFEHMHPGSHWLDTSMPADWRPTYLEEADAVLAVLPELTGQTTNQAAYRLAADAVRDTIAPADWDADAVSIWNAATNIAETKLRRLANEAQPTIGRCANCGHAPHGHAESLSDPRALVDCPHCPCAAELRELVGCEPADETAATECSCGVLRTGPGRHLPECPNRTAAGARQDWVEMRARAERAEAERDSYGEQLDEAAERIAELGVEVNRLTAELAGPTTDRGAVLEADDGGDGV